MCRQLERADRAIACRGMRACWPGKFQLRIFVELQIHRHLLDFLPTCRIAFLWMTGKFPNPEVHHKIISAMTTGGVTLKQ